MIRCLRQMGCIGLTCYRNKKIRRFAFSETKSRHAVKRGGSFFQLVDRLGIIQDGLRFQSTTADSSRGEFVQLKLGAHFLNLRRLLFQFFFESLHFLLLLRDDRSLFLHCAMLFEELIK